jgi:hypothetical protein
MALRLATCPKWLIIGDFNLIYQAFDKNNGNLDLRLMGQFHCALQNRKFTWSNERETPTLIKLDRAYVIRVGISPSTTMCCTPCPPTFGPIYQISMRLCFRVGVDKTDTLTVILSSTISSRSLPRGFRHGATWIVFQPQAVTYHCFRCHRSARCGRGVQNLTKKRKKHLWP